MSTTRRTFLRQLGAVGVVSLGGTPPLFLARAAAAAEKEAAQDTTGKVLVLVQMAGGNDGLNTVVPYADPEYRRARPGIGLSKGEVLRIDDHVGLHPGMTGFKELYDEGMLGIVQGVGYPRPDRSHFRSMDIWHTARPAARPENETVSTEMGWLGRALDLTASTHAGTMPALAFGSDRLPLALVASKVHVPTIRSLKEYRLSLGSGSKADRKLRRRLIEELADRPDGATGSELDFLRKTALTALSTSDRLEDVTSSDTTEATYPPNGLARKLEKVAQIIAADLGTRIIFVSLGGFDTHSQQKGAHTALLTELSSAVAAFFEDLKGRRLDERVLVATYSEFGRRVKENGSLGTDHGAASQLFIASPKVKGGIHGKHPSLTDLTRGDLKFHTDFRSVYATLLESWLGFPSEPVLEGKFKTLDFV